MATVDSCGPDPPDDPRIPNVPWRLPRDEPLPGEVADRAARAREYRRTVDADYGADAVERGCDRVREVEEKVVTPAMRRIEAEDPDRHLAGLDNRRKGTDRLAEKVMRAMQERNRTPEEAFAEVKDAMRYTFVYSAGGYATGVPADCERLKAEGFEFVDHRNTWENEEYKGINSWWREPVSRLLFEVQFHTQASYDAKQLTHAAYERIRDPAAPDDEIRKARAFQREIIAAVSIPDGAANCVPG